MALVGDSVETRDAGSPTRLTGIGALQYCFVRIFAYSNVLLSIRDRRKQVPHPDFCPAINKIRDHPRGPTVNHFLHLNGCENTLTITNNPGWRLESLLAGGSDGDASILSGNASFCIVVLLVVVRHDEQLERFCVVAQQVVTAPTETAILVGLASASIVVTTVTTTAFYERQLCGCRDGHYTVAHRCARH